MELTRRTFVKSTAVALASAAAAGTMAGCSALAGTGDWQEGQRFGSSAARSDVADWLMGLGFTVR